MNRLLLSLAILAAFAAPTVSARTATGHVDATSGPSALVTRTADGNAPALMARTLSAAGDGVPSTGAALRLTAGPSPTRPGPVTVRLSASTADLVTVAVYDALGRQVALLASAEAGGGAVTRPVVTR